MEIEQVIKLIEALSDSKLTGFKYETEEVKLQLTKKQGKAQMAAVDQLTGGSQRAAEGQLTGESQRAAEGQLTGESQRTAGGQTVSSPLVGIFYAAPAEGAEPFVTLGTQVKKGQALGIIEAMKLMNEIESDYEGAITEILVENGQPVEYGQPLFRIG